MRIHKQYEDMDDRNRDHPIYRVHLHQYDSDDSQIKLKTEKADLRIQLKS